MEIVKRKLSDLISPEYNPRKKLKPKDEEYQKIKRSIEKFGYADLIVINKDNTIIGGNQRTQVMKDLGYNEVDCVMVDLDKDDEKALNVALNKITGEWDEKKLNDLILDLDKDGYDWTLTGFDEFEFDFGLDDSEPEYKENERERTNENYNLRLFDPDRAEGYFQMPIIENDEFIPKDIIGFNYAKTNEEKHVGVHFYIDDYQFERIWNNPEDYFEVLCEYDCIFSPDFSLYMDMSMATKIWNVYRSRLIGQYYQSHGLIVIPTISWAEKETFEFCFDGIPEGSIVSVSTIGVKRNSESFQIWKDGMDEMIKRIKPSHIIVYGGQVEYDYGDIDVIYFDNRVTERMKELKISDER